MMNAKNLKWLNAAGALMSGLVMLVGIQTGDYFAFKVGGILCFFNVTALLFNDTKLFD
jgi:hypothetical protein